MLKPRRRLSATQQILIGLVVGAVVGAVVNRIDPHYADVFQPFAQLFVRLIKMVVAPIIFASLVAGIAGAGHLKSVGRMGVRALIYFEIVTTLALVIGLFAVNLVRPGDGVVLPAGATAIDLAGRKPQSWSEILLHTVPTSVVKAMAEGDVLQIVVFSVFFAVALNMLKERGRPVVELCEIVAETMFKVCGIVMAYAPVGVAAALAYAIGHSGFGVLKNLFALVATLYGALVVFWLVVLLPIALWARIPLRRFFRLVKEPALIAFSTTSSEAALPKAMENLEKMGVPKRIVSFILPLGYSFNLDGTTLYLSLAAIFVAQVSHVELTLLQQITLLMTLLITSKGVAAVPRASFVILAGTLSDFNLPLDGLTLILGVDALMDMARTMVNVTGNCLATVLVAKWEGELGDEQPATLETYDDEESSLNLPDPLNA